MPRKALDKIIITEEMKERQLRLRKFLRSSPEIEFKELKPIGFSIDTSTIPLYKTAEFLEIANSVKF